MAHRSPVVSLLTAGLLAAAAQRLLPLPGDDPLRSTLVVLPVIVAALREIGRWAERHGGRARDARADAAELAALGLVVLLALGGSSLGWEHGRLASQLLFTALCLLLALRVGRLLLALRPCLGAELPRRPPWAFLFLPLTVYLAILPWSTEQRPPDGDEPHYLLITHSLAYDLDERLSNNYEQADSLAFLDRRLAPQPGDPVGADGERYSRHNLTLPLVLAPAYRLAGKLGALATMALLAAVLARESLRLARRYRPRSPGAVLLGWSILSFTAPLLLYSHQVWVEVPAALLAVVVLERVHRLRQGEPLGRGGWLAVAGCLMLLPLLKFRFAVVGGCLLLLLSLAGLRHRRRQVLIAAAGFAAASAAILALNHLLFDNALRYYSLEAVLRLYRTAPGDYLRGLAGMLGDCAFGLLAFAPVWLLLVPGSLRTLRRPRLLMDLGLAYAPYLVLFGPRGEWFGGWSPPFRYAVVSLPLLAMLLIPALEERRRWGARTILVALGALTGVLTLVWVTLPGWTYNLADGRSHLLDFLSGLLDGDAARFFPSYVRPRPAAWIWPAAALLLLLPWRLGRRSRRGARSWGTAAVLVVAALLPLAVGAVPSRVVEFEDPWVGKSGGALYPDRWTPGRSRFRGGWVLEPGARVSAPLVVGGGRLELVLELRLHSSPERSPELWVAEGRRRLARLRPRPTSEWQTARVGPLPWRGEGPLVVEAVGGGRLLLDRARLSWR